MPDFQTTYSVTQRLGFEGQKVDGENYNAITRLCETAGGINFGRAVMRGAADGGCAIGSAAMTLATFLGVSVRDVSLRPTLGDKYAQGSNVSILNAGSIWVIVGEAVAQGDTPLWDSGTGKWMKTGGAGRVAVPAGWYFDTAAALNGLCKLVKR